MNFKNGCMAAVAVLVFVTNVSFAGDVLSVRVLNKAGMQANSSIKREDLRRAQEIMLGVQQKTLEGIKNGKGPFYAEIYDENGKFVTSASNSVVEDKCSLNHAEMNALKNAHKIYADYNLKPKNLTIYVNAEPCIMCTGGLMWAGIRTIYFGVPSKDVEKITGFDEGFKPDWLKEFKKRGINVYGNIEPEAGKKVLQEYVNNGGVVYKPEN